MKRLLTLVVLAAVVATGCNSRLHVQGRQLVNTEGQETVLRGANTIRSEWDGSMALERQSLPKLATSWKGNVIVRGFASGPVNARDATYLGWLDEYVGIARQQDIYLILVFRSSARDGAQPARPDSAATAALTYLANRYKAEEQVMFGLQVEPHDVSWATIRPQWESMIDSIRGPSGSANASFPTVFVPGVRWGHDVSGAITDPVRRANVVYKVHPYGPQSYWQRDFIDAWNAGLPIFVGEFSLAPDLESTMTEVNALLKWTRDHRVGWAAWIFDTCGCGAGQEDLITDFSSANPTSPFGTTVKAAMPGG